MDQSLRELAHTLQMRGVLVEEPRFFFGGDLPSDHLLTMDGALSMRRATKKQSRRRRSRAPTARQHNVRKTQPCERREATSYRAIPVATAALRDSTVDAIGIDTI